MAPQSKKKSQGRRKIEMKLIADENARVVAFSKRRSGLFKKATELSILCGAQIALIIFSFGGRAYSFGHPNVESVVDCFLNRNPMPPMPDSVQGMIHAAMLQQLKEQCDKKNEELKAKKKRGKEIEEAMENSQGQMSEERIGRLNLPELENLKQMLEKLRENVHLQAVAPRLESGDPSSSSNADEPLIPEKEVDLSNVEKNGSAASPIPADWLKL